jgi:ribonucleoside-diphosphate reductase alpha chain
MNLNSQPAFQLNPPPAPRSPMRVTKRSGLHEPVDLSKIVRAVARCSDGIP